MSTLEDLEKQMLSDAQSTIGQYSAKRKREAKSAAEQIDSRYDSLIKDERKQYEATAKTAEESFRPIYDANAVNELVMRRQIRERIANMGLSDSGLNATQQTAISLSRGRADSETTRRKNAAVDAVMSELDDVRAQYNAQRAQEKRDMYSAVEEDIREYTATTTQQAYENAASAYTAQQQQQQSLQSYLDSIPELPDIGAGSLPQVRLEVLCELNSGRDTAMTDAFHRLASSVKDGTITNEQMNSIMREFGILSPSQQEFFQRGRTDPRYPASMSNEELRTIARRERESESAVPSQTDLASLSAFSDEYRAYIEGALKDSEALHYDNAASVYETYKTEGERLRERGKEMLTFLDSQRKVLGEETYTKWYEFVRGVLDNETAVREQLRTQKEELAAFESREAYVQAEKSAKAYEEMASYDLVGTAGVFSQKTDILRRQRDRDEEYARLLEQQTQELREEYTRNGLVGTAHLDYKEMAREKIEEELARIPTLDKDSEEYRLMESTDVFRIAQQDRVIREAIASFGYADIERFEADVRAEEHKRQVSAYIQHGNKLYEDAVKAADFKEKSRFDDSIRDTQYRFINGESLKADVYDSLPTLLKSIYQYMDEKQIAVYNYYYAKRGKEAAEEYLSVIEDAISSEKADKLFASLEDNWWAEQGFAFAAGLDQFASGIKNAFSDREGYIPASAIQKTSGYVREDLYGEGGLGGTLSRVLYDVNTSVSNMVPSVLTSAAATYLTTKFTGNAGLGLKVGNTIGSATMGLSASGNAYAEAINLGYSKEQARLYGVLVGASESCLQYALGGVTKLGGVATSNAMKAIDAISTGFANTALKFGAKMLAEGCEEGLQEMLTPLFKMVAANDHTSVDWAAVAESFVIGALTGAVFELGENGASKAAKTINTKRAGEAILDSGSLNGLKELASLLPEDSKAFELAQRVDEASGAYRIGELYAAVCEELGVKKAAQTLPVETTVDPDIEREQMLDEMTREVIRDLETRRSIEKAPLHQRKVLENIIAELDKLRPKYQHVSPFLDTTAPDARSQPATVRAPVVSAPSSVSAKAVGAAAVSATAPSAAKTKTAVGDSGGLRLTDADSLPSSSPSRNVDKAVLPQYNKVDTAVAGKIDALETEVSQQQQRVNGVAKLPRIKCRNQRLAGKRHPKTGVLFTERVVTLGGQQYVVVAPEFDSAFDAQLPEELRYSRDKTQFKECNRQLWNAIQSNPQLKAMFSDEQLMLIKNGHTPEGYTWHHDVEVGKMQLVLTEIHSNTNHTGGRSLWGGGKKYR